MEPGGAWWAIFNIRISVVKGITWHLHLLMWSEIA